MHEKLRDMGGSSEKRIVKAIEFFDDEQYFYIVTQWMQLNDVRTHMIRCKIPYLTEQEISKPMRHILEALNAVHKAGFLHNDITPQNILLDKKEGKKKISAKLAGFH